MSVALVTGGCRRIGAAVAARLARLGHDLALHAHSDTEPEPALATVLTETGVRWRVFPADLSEPDAVEALPDRVAAHFGTAPAILINSASRFGQDTPADVAADAMLDHYAVNTVAPAILARRLAATAGSDKPVTIVNILDQRIAAPHGDQLSYTLSKLALAELTQILARHYAPHVRVNGVAPGLTLPTDDYDAAQMQRLARLMPLDRLAAPEEIADAVAWLVGARSVTGQVLFVDGGAHLCRYARDFMFLERE